MLMRCKICDESPRVSKDGTKVVCRECNIIIQTDHRGATRSAEEYWNKIHADSKCKSGGECACGLHDE